MNKPYYNKRLADKMREVNPQAFDKMRCGFIENEIRANGYPSENAELAILRKQIKNILDVLKASGIDAMLPEFLALHETAEAAKNSVKEWIL